VDEESGGEPAKPDSSGKLPLTWSWVLSYYGKILFCTFRGFVVADVHIACILGINELM